MQEAGTPCTGESGVCLEAALRSLLNIHPLRVHALIYPCLLRDPLASWPKQLSAVGEKFLFFQWHLVVELQSFDPALVGTQDACPPWLKSEREEVRSEQSTLFLLLVLIRYQKSCASPIRR